MATLNIGTLVNGAAGGGTTIAITLTGVNAGDAIIVTGFAGKTTALLAGDCTDDAGNTYILDESSWVNGSPSLGIWQCQSAVSTGTRVITLSNLNNAVARHINAFSVPSLTATPLDVHTNSAGGPTTSVVSGTTGATVQADEIVVAIATSGASTSISSPAGGGSGVYTSFGNSNGIGNCVQLSYLETAATGTQAATWTSNGSALYRACIVTYLVAAAGPAPYAGMNTSMQSNG